jgi:hypothetical protein
MHDGEKLRDLWLSPADCSELMACNILSQKGKQLRKTGNALFKEGKFHAAIAAYTDGLQAK